MVACGRDRCWRDHAGVHGVPDRRWRMSPGRLARRRHFPVYVASVLVVAAFAVAAWALHVRSSQLDRRSAEISQLVFDNCVANERQDAVIGAQLRAARIRAIATLPAGSPVLAHQLEVISDGIRTLEPPDEQ